MASARTSCECMRRLDVCAQRVDDELEPFSLLVLMTENWMVFWSTPEV